MLQGDECLAALINRFDPESQTLTSEYDRCAVESNLSTQTGRRLLQDFMADYLAPRSFFWPRSGVAPGHSLPTFVTKDNALVNLGIVQDLSHTVGTDFETLKFRVDLYFRGLQPWARLTGWYG